MKCYGSEEWSAYLYDERLDKDRKGEMEAHLKTCSGCKKDVESLEKTVGLLKNYGKIEEERACIEIELLYAYRNNRLDLNEKKRVEGHLRICRQCQGDIKLFDKFPLKEAEEAEKFSEVPIHLAKKLQDLYSVFYSERAASLQEKIKEKIKNLAVSISNVQQIFNVDLTPEPVYRGEERTVSELPRVVCLGGDMILNLCGKGSKKTGKIRVTLMDDHHRPIQTGKPDKLGQIRFKDIPRGSYIVSIEHYRIQLREL